MPRVSARLTRGGNYPALVAQHYRASIQQMEMAALRAVDTGSRRALRDIRATMASASLGRLGQAIGQTSDLAKGRDVKRYANGGFSASGVLFVRSSSERTMGALEAYTQGADIRPVRSRWLWIATDEIPRVTNRQRMTPALYRANGFEQKIGPLVQIRSVNGNPLLVAKKVGVSAVGKARSARSLTKSGRARKGQREKEFVVAFIGIPRTARAARVNVREIIGAVQNDLPALFAQEMGRRAR